jgi:hypothetical protein
MQPPPMVFDAGGKLWVRIMLLPPIIKESATIHADDLRA